MKYKLGELSIFHGIHELYNFSDIKAVNNSQVLVLWGKRKAKYPSCPEELWFLVLNTESSDCGGTHTPKDDTLLKIDWPTNLLLYPEFAFCNSLLLIKY